MTVRRSMAARGAGRRVDGALRSAIFDAAMTEFAEKGFAGARVERIASAAGANRAMLYYYYGSKNRLFSQVLAAACARCLPGAGPLPGDPIEWLLAWCQRGDRDDRLLRVVEWAIIERRFISGSEMAGAAQTLLALVGGPHEHSMAVRLSGWVLVAAAVLPILWPSVTEAVVGEQPSSPRFQAEHARLLRAMVDVLGSRDGRRLGARTPRAPSPPAS